MSTDSTDPGEAEAFAALSYGAEQAERETLEDPDVGDPLLDGSSFLHRLAERLEVLKGQVPNTLRLALDDPPKVIARARAIADALSAEFTARESGPPPVRFFDTVLGVHRLLVWEEGDESVGIAGGWTDRDDTAPPELGVLLESVTVDACRAAGFAGAEGFDAWCSRLAESLANRLATVLQSYDKTAREAV